MADTKLRILGVNAHPHDFTHYAGTLGIHTSRGDTATVVSMTPGTTVHNEALHDELMKPEAERDPAIVNQSVDEIAAGKAKEIRDACAIVGVSDVRVLDFPQPFRVQENPKAIEALRDIILDVRPHIMITQSPHLGNHSRHVDGTADDHSQTAFASMEARSQAGSTRHGGAPHSIAMTLFPGVYFDRHDWDFVVDISDWYDQRVQAENCYVSQGHTDPWSRRRMLVSLGNAGWFSNTLYAEGFVRENVELHSGIPISPETLRAATEPIQEHYKRMIGEAGKDFPV